MRIVFLISVALGGCAHVDAPVAAAPVAEYRLGTDDLVEVSVWKEPALSTIVPVRPDGKVSLPMVGELAAFGRTAAELRTDVAARLKPYIAEPVVAVMVKEVRSSRFFVLGEVAHPGAFPLSGQLTVLEAISTAGGPTEFAHTRRVVVIRHPRGPRPERLPVDFDDVLAGKSAPLPLAPGDTVYVP